MRWKFAGKIALYAFILVAYRRQFRSALFIYSVKSKVGFDIFNLGGFHTYMGCLSVSFPPSVGANLRT
jgi:hypothetical protein